jgi:hypothetical protein
MDCLPGSESDKSAENIFADYLKSKPDVNILPYATRITTLRFYMEFNNVNNF